MKRHGGETLPYAGLHIPEIENFDHMPYIVWLAGSELMQFQKLREAFLRFTRLNGNHHLKMGDVCHVWSKSEGFWQSEGTILISIQTTPPFADFLLQNYPVDSTTKDSHL